jgi:hypothetical protein
VKVAAPHEQLAVSRLVSRLKLKRDPLKELLLHLKRLFALFKSVIRCIKGNVQFLELCQ